MSDDERYSYQGGGTSFGEIKRAHDESELRLREPDVPGLRRADRDVDERTGPRQQRDELVEHQHFAQQGLVADDDLADRRLLCGERGEI